MQFCTTVSCVIDWCVRLCAARMAISSCPLNLCSMDSTNWSCTLTVTRHPRSLWYLILHTQWISDVMLCLWFQRTTNRKWPMGNQMVTWPMIWCAVMFCLHRFHWCSVLTTSTARLSSYQRQRLAEWTVVFLYQHHKPLLYTHVVCCDIICNMI